MPMPGTGVALRSDLSATLFLCEPDEYEGGELQIEGPFGVQSVKLPAGDMILYPSSSLHRVAPVTRGARIASFFWIESLVREDAARALLFDLDRSIQGLTPAVAPDDRHMLGLTGVYHNLLRRWASP
jgi:PKHD-type hydroxylase